MSLRHAAFAGKAPAAVSGEAVLAYASSLALFTPAAFHHFLATYLLYAIQHPESEVASCLSYALGPGDGDDFYTVRLNLFSPEEKAATLAVVEYLRPRNPLAGEVDVYDLVRRYWAAA